MCEFTARADFLQKWFPRAHAGHWALGDRHRGRWASGAGGRQAWGQKSGKPRSGRSSSTEGTMATAAPARSARVPTPESTPTPRRPAARAMARSADVSPTTMPSAGEHPRALHTRRAGSADGFGATPASSPHTTAPTRSNTPSARSPACSAHSQNLGPHPRQHQHPHPRPTGRGTLPQSTHARRK